DVNAHESDGLPMGLLDPPGIEIDADLGCFLRMAELVEVGDPDDTVVPLGDHVMPPQQYPIEGTGTGDQGFPVGGADDLIDELVDDGRANTHEIARSLDVGIAGVPVIPL